MFLTNVDLIQCEATIVGERMGDLTGFVGVLADAEAEVHAVGLVSERPEHVPETEGVLSSRHGHEDAVVVAHHRELVDGLFHLSLDVVLETGGAEPGIVAAHLHDRRLAAATALHRRDPPEITGRNSMVSPSATSASLVMSVSARMTITVSGLTSR